MCACPGAIMEMPMVKAYERRIGLVKYLIIRKIMAQSFQFLFASFI
jgi:hypothetical protein